MNWTNSRKSFTAPQVLFLNKIPKIKIPEETITTLGWVVKTELPAAGESHYRLHDLGQCSQLSPCRHLAITDNPIIRTAAKSLAKINCRCLTEINCLREGG